MIYLCINIYIYIYIYILRKCYKLVRTIYPHYLKYKSIKHDNNLLVYYFPYILDIGYKSNVKQNKK